MSYLVGYGPKYPIHVHHRGSSIASIFSLHSRVECVDGFETWYHRSEANPNIIYGGLVGGPDKNDNFIDDRSNYEQTEPTISGSAPLIGLFSKLQDVYGYKNPGKVNKYYCTFQIQIDKVKSLQKFTLPIFSCTSLLSQRITNFPPNKTK